MILLFRIVIFTLTSSMLLISCGAPKISFSNFRQTEQDKEVAKNKLPSYVIKEKLPKIIVLPPMDSSQYRMCKLSEKAQSHMIAALVKYGHVDLVERAQAQKIMNEVNFKSNLSGNIDTKGLMQGGQGIDYALVGSITSASTGATYTPAKYWTYKGKSYKSDASCTEQGDVAVSYRLIEFPTGRVKQTFELKGSGSANIGSGACRVQDPCQLLSTAMGSALNSINSKKEIAAEFPLYGYIWKIISDGEKRGLYISLGANDDIVPGDELDVIRFDDSLDPVSNTIASIPQVITTCTITKGNISENRSICLADGKHANLIKLKYAVRTKVKLDWAEKIFK